MADTGRAAARHLALLLRTRQRFAKAFRQLPFLIPISWQCTNDRPTKGIYQKLASLESDAVPTLSFAPGFPAADFAHCGPSVFAYGKTQADADTAADELTKLIVGHEDDFDGRIFTPDEGVRHAMELAKTATRLKGLDSTLQEQIINWGYAVCDAGIRKHVDSSLPVPMGFPYPDAGI